MQDIKYNNSSKITNSANTAINNNNINKNVINSNNKNIKKDTSKKSNKNSINKKSDIPRNKNNIKYEDKFCMMNEEDISAQKRNIYNNEESEKNYKNEKEDEKDWNYIQKKEIIRKYSNNEEEENNNNDDIYNNNDDMDNNDDTDKIDDVDNNEIMEKDEEDKIQIYNEDQINEELKKIGEDIINTHINIIREAANILSQEGDLITNIIGVGKLQNFTIEEYISGLEIIVDKKLDLYGGIKGKINTYKKLEKSKNGKTYNFLP